jgi:hypothetical protein
VSAVGAGEEGSVKRLGGLLPPLLKGLGIEEGVRFEGIKRDWTSIFREPLSLHMCPSRLQNGELLIHVDSTVWLHQISFYKEEILRNLAPFGVKDVRFRLGRVDSKRPRSPRLQQKHYALDSAALRQIEEAVSGMEEGPVKESVKRAMEKALSAKKNKS